MKNRGIQQPGTSRRTSLAARFFVLLMGAAVVVWSLISAVGPGRPNVLLISLDTVRADHLGAYGYEKDTSPFLDRFAAQSGILFENNLAAAPSTEPSHASMFTSLLPSHHGALFSRRAPLGEEFTTLAEILQDAGYDTVSINDGGQLDAMWGLDQGFGTYFSFPGAAIEAKFAKTVTRALKWFDQRVSANRPWFMFLHTYEPHHPYNADRRFYELLGHAYDGPLPLGLTKEKLREINEGKVVLTKKDEGHIVAAYDAEIRSTDERLGELLQRLGSRGLLEDTVVIITSDHGEELGERGMWGWHSHALFDEQLRVPLIIRLPGDKHRGTRIGDQVRGIDLLPTITDILGLDAPAICEGRSVMSLLSASEKDPRGAVSQRDIPLEPLPVAYTESRYKLYSKEGEENSRLYDLQTDPGEMKDIAEARPEEVNRLVQIVAELLAERPFAAAVDPVDLGDELEQQLESLGYLDGGRDAGDPGDGAY